MKFLLKKDTLIVTLILSIIIVATYFNLQVSFRRSRDFQRKEDVRAIANALNRYQDEFGFFPISLDGKILACGPVDLTKQQPVYTLCEWGVDGLADLSDPNYPPYLEKLPTDPHNSEGVRYYYLSDGKGYQVLAALESAEEAEYDEEIARRGIACGNRVCNFGLFAGKMQ